LTKEKRQKTFVFQLLEKAWIRSILTVFSVLLMIGGPTFLIYILQRLGVPHPLLILIGLASFTIGTLLFMGIAKEEKST
jgi:hypothetical protein